MTDPRDEDPELNDIDDDTDADDAVPHGRDEVPDVKEDAVEDDPTIDHQSPTI